VRRVGAAMQAMLYAAVVTTIIWRFNLTLRFGALFLTFAVFSVAFYFLWTWIFVERPAELAKKLPISSKELRRKHENFTIACLNDGPECRNRCNRRSIRGEVKDIFLPRPEGESDSVTSSPVAPCEPWGLGFVPW